MHPMFVIVLAQRSLTKLDTMSNLIKEGYFNLSTILNLKSQWMYQLNTSKPEHTSINNGSMNFKVQAMFKWRLVNSGLHTWVHLPPACRMDVLILLQWWHWSYLVVDDSSISDAGWNRGGHIDHADSGDSKAGSHTQLVCWALVACSIAPMMQEWWRMVRSLSCMWANAEHGEATEAWKERGVFLLLYLWRRC